MNETEIQRVSNGPMYPRNSKTYSGKGFVNIDNGSQGGTHWCCFIIKDNKSFCFDSFGEQPDKFLLNYLPKPIIDHIYKIQDINSKSCRSYCSYFFFSVERMNCFGTISKIYFD